MGAVEDFTTISYDISNTQHHRILMHKYGAIQMNKHLHMRYIFSSVETATPITDIKNIKFSQLNLSIYDFQNNIGGQPPRNIRRPNQFTIISYHFIISLFKFAP